MPKTRLNEHQLAFVDEYIVNGGVATAAYRSVYGCADNTASVESCRLMKHPIIQEKIREHREALFAERKLGANEFADKMLKLADNEKHGIHVRHKYYDTYAKLCGYYKEHSLVEHINVEDALANADLETLEKLFIEAQERSR